jgi:aryl-alcohol dehydrogenase-like predicted oxidoreductase
MSDPMTWPAERACRKAAEDEVERLREALDVAHVDAEEMNAHRNELLAEVERLQEKCDRYEAAIRWVLARNTSGIVLGGYDKPMVMHLLGVLNA